MIARYALSLASLSILCIAQTTPDLCSIGFIRRHRRKSAPQRREHLDPIGGRARQNRRGRQ